jgi:hypothetical protein
VRRHQHLAASVGARREQFECTTTVRFRATAAGFHRAIGHTYDVGRIKNSKPCCSNIALAVIERRYTR